MKHLKNEKGSSLVYLLWIFTATIVLFLIVTNIARVYIVKQQASAAAELAALAATGEILIVTEEAIKEFDLAMEVWAINKGFDYDPLWNELENEINTLISNGKSKNEAYIKVFNDRLPGNLFEPMVGIDTPPNLKSIIVTHFNENGYLANRMNSTVKRIIRENEANDEPGHVEIIISEDKNRVEVKTDATFETLTDNSDDNPIAYFEKDIPQKGYGPPLIYLEEVLR